MNKYVAVIAGNHKQADQTAVVHHHWCSGIMEDACEWMMLGRKVVIAQLDSDEKVSVGVEIKIISGAKVRAIWHKCATKSPIHEKYRMNSGGGWMLDDGVRGNKKVICTYCGAVNITMDTTCKSCGASLWQGFDERMAEYNRRLREGVKENDKRLIAISRQSIQSTVDIMGDMRGWSIDSNGYARKAPSKKEKAPEYNEE